ncbi:MAG: hypothetical protein KGI41_04250 [Patescibacteria group bacterium]|nr:hypothetical protein [Patescibacteria group bacterium]
MNAYKKRIKDLEGFGDVVSVERRDAPTLKGTIVEADEYGFRLKHYDMHKTTAFVTTIAYEDVRGLTEEIDADLDD